MKYSARFTAHTRVIGYVLIKDRNADVLTPKLPPLPCLNLEYLFYWRVRSLKQPNCFSVLCSGVLYNNAKDAGHFLKYMGHKGCAFVWDERRW